MARKDTSNFTVLFSDVPGDEERVRAVLSEWGLEENSIYRLLTEGRTGHPALPQLVEGRLVEEVATASGTGTRARGGHAGHWRKR